MSLKYEPLLRFMKERHKIYIKRTFGEPKPWTKDPILQGYRFCNVYRELDAVTVWIRLRIREPYDDNPNLWFMLCMARQINWPATLHELMVAKAWPVKSYNWEKTRQVMLTRQARGDKLYTGAYMLNAHGTAPDDPKDKAFFTTKLVLDKLWKERLRMEEALMTKSLATVAAHLELYHGWGGFTAAQAVADIKYTAQLKDATDWWTWAAPGPGSIRGMNVVAGREITDRLKPADWLAEVNELREKINKKWTYEPLHAQDMQNCLCEYFKYTRGWSRSRYNGLPE